MPVFLITKLDEGASPPRSIPGARCTVFVPDIPPHLRTPRQFLRWLTTNPNIIGNVVTNLFPLVDQPNAPPEPLKNPAPPP